MTELSLGNSRVDVNTELETEIVSQGTFAIQKFKTEAEISKYLKEYFDSKYGPNWHCVVGRHFAHFGSHHQNAYAFVHIGQVAVLLYKMD